MKTLLDWFFRLLQKIGTERRYQVSFGVSTAGLMMIIVSHLLDSHAGLHLIRTILLEIGIACIIAAIAEFLLLKHASEVFRQEVQEDIKKLDDAVTTFQQEVRQDMKMIEHADERFRQEVQGDMKILSHCLEHQLVDVMPPLNLEQEKQAVKEITSAIENARGEIRIIAFTLRDILNDRMSLDDPLQQLFKKSNEKVDVKLLLIDPTSAAAHIRVIAEEGPGALFEKSRLHRTLRRNLDLIKDLMEDAENKKDFKIEALFYNILPSFYMLSTQDEVFIEPCHLGRLGGEGVAIVGVVPLLRFRSGSPMYQFAQSHFSHIWDSRKKESATGDGAPHNNGYIQIKTMEEVDREIERRLAERRSRTSQVNAERRSSDRRHTNEVKVKSATIGSTVSH